MSVHQLFVKDARIVKCGLHDWSEVANAKHKYFLRNNVVCPFHADIEGQCFLAIWSHDDEPCLSVGEWFCCGCKRTGSLAGISMYQSADHNGYMVPCEVRLETGKGTA